MGYYISDNFRKRYGTLTEARKAIMTKYKDFQLRAVFIPIVTERLKIVGTVNEPGTFPMWETYGTSNKFVRKKWVLKADGTLGRRLN